MVYGSTKVDNVNLIYLHKILFCKNAENIRVKLFSGHLVADGSFIFKNKIIIKYSTFSAKSCKDFH